MCARGVRTGCVQGVCAGGVRRGCAQGCAHGVCARGVRTQDNSLLIYDRRLANKIPAPNPGLPWPARTASIRADQREVSCTQEDLRVLCTHTLHTRVADERDGAHTFSTISWKLGRSDALKPREPLPVRLGSAAQPWLQWLVRLETIGGNPRDIEDPRCMPIHIYNRTSIYIYTPTSRITPLHKGRLGYTPTTYLCDQHSSIRLATPLSALCSCWIGRVPA